MKKLIAFLMAFVLSTTVCACGGRGAASSGQTAESTASADNSVAEQSNPDTDEKSEREVADAGQNQEQNEVQNQEQEAGSEIAAENTEDSTEKLDENSDEYAELSALGDVQVENGILTVSITLPADLAQGTTQEQLDAASGTAYVSAALNEDGSVTFKMTRAQHKAMLEQLSTSFEESIQGLINDNENYTISGVTHNDDFTVFDVTLDGTSIGFGDYFSAMSLYLCGGMYGVFSGHRPEHVIVNFLDSDGNLIESSDSANMAQ